MIRERHERMNACIACRDHTHLLCIPAIGPFPSSIISKCKRAAIRSHQHSISQKQKGFNKLVCLIVTMNIIAILISAFLALHSTNAHTGDSPNGEVKMVSELLARISSAGSALVFEFLCPKRTMHHQRHSPRVPSFQSFVSVPLGLVPTLQHTAISSNAERSDGERVVDLPKRRWVVYSPI
jgi:hypothetical protein